MFDSMGWGELGPSKFDGVEHIGRAWGTYNDDEKLVELPAISL